jgi:hypothetical protein
MKTEIAKTALMAVAVGLVLGIAATANAGSVMPGAYDTAIQTGPLTGPVPRPSRSVTLVKPVAYDTAIIEGSLDKEITVSGARPSGETEFAVMQPEAGQGYWELHPLD